MTQSNASSTGNANEAKLPRRDLVILPLIGLLTIAFLLGTSELTARLVLPVSDVNSCLVNDAQISFRYRPNCTARLKAAEGPWELNQYNECGYRTKQSCGPKPSGSTRVALVGASDAEGYYVEYDDSIAARTAKGLTRKWGRPVEIQNEGRQGCYQLCVFHRIEETLALKPDLVILEVNVQYLSESDTSDFAHRYEPMQTSSPPAAGLLEKIRSQIRDSRALLWVLHTLYQDPSTYLRIYSLKGTDENYMRPSLSPLWEDHLQSFDFLLGEMVKRYRSKQVPFVLLVAPNIAQASVLAMQPPPANMDVYALNRRLKDIASRHGIQFVDAFELFRQTPGSNRFFYMADGHMNADGNALMSDALVEQLSKENIPAFATQNDLRLPTDGGPF